MASFTDQISQFNPYIQELPVQEMVQVGMHKQAQYDQGVQKIQNYIDRVGGVELYRPQDRQLLQSKLNELGSKLKTVAAGDFSNQQLVNSVAGMTGQIIKDEDVRNAVSSTQQYKKAIKEREEYLKAGKTSPSNDMLLREKTEKWFNGDLKETFSGGYEPYTNWRKEAVDVIKGITKDGTISENSFTTTTDPKTGKTHVVLADAITRTKYAGISPEKIQQALLVGLSPAAMRQMEIDGMYTYSNINKPEDFKQILEDRHKDNASFYIEQKTKLTNALSSTNSGSEKALLESKIKDLDKTLAGLDETKNKLIKQVNEGNLRGAKATLYSMDAINNFSKPFSFTETSVTKETSPEAVMAMERIKLNQAWDIHKDNMTMEKEKIRLSKEANEIAKLANAPYGGFPDTIDQSLLPKVNNSTLTETTNKDKTLLDTSDSTFIKNNGKDITWFDQQKAAWERSPNGVDASISQYFKTTEALRRKTESNMGLLLNLRDEAVSKFGSIDQLIPKNAPTVNYANRTTGERYTYTPRDFVDFNNIYTKYVTSSRTAPGGSITGVPLSSSSIKVDYEKAKNELSPKQFHLLNVATGKVPLVGGEKTLRDNVYFYQDNVNNPYKKTIEKVNDYIDQGLKERFTVSQGMSYNVPANTPAQKASLVSMLASAANIGEKQGGFANSPLFNASTLKEIASEDNPNVRITVVQGTEIQPTMYKVSVLGNKGKSTEFMMTPEQKNLTFGVSFNSPASQAASPYIDQLNKTGGFTTARDGSGKTTPENAWLGPIDFTNVQHFGTKANLIQPDPINSPGMYQIRYTIFNPLTRQWSSEISFPRNGLMGRDQIVPAMQQTSDAVIFELLYDRPATADDLQKIQKASKKPL
jgi:hypothetical protein